MLKRLAAVLSLWLLGGCTIANTPDTILINGKIFTATPAQPWVQALAIRGDRVIAAGDVATIAAIAGASTRRIDVGGRTVVPGFNDAHQHIPIFPPSDHLTLPFDPTLEQIAAALREQIKK